MERRLAAILAADVVGYTALMSADEAGTHRRLTALRRSVIEPLIGRSRGRVFKHTGDGLLAEFHSMVDAVECALAWQKAVAEDQAAVSAEQRLRFRIGVNLGDVIVEDDDIHGDGVNIAARLEGLAEPGGVWLSGDAWRQVRGKVDAAFEGLGPHRLRNVSEPVEVFRIAPPETERPKPRQLPSQRPAVAVLPFDNMSRDPEQDYFSEGLAEDIITALSHWRSFPVIARNSSFSFRGQQVRVQTIAEELGARYVLEGSVRRSGERLRITAQLIDAESGHHVWAERFDRSMEDVFDVQDEITNRIAATVMPELENFERRQVTRKRTEDLDAWDYYLRGMETFFEETCEGAHAAIRNFKVAVRLDPDYCDAWARLGWSYTRLVMHHCPGDRGAFLSEAFAAARKAVALDNASALAHMSLGTAHIWAEDLDIGLAEARTALQLNPNFAHAAMAVGNRLDLVGQTDEAVVQLEHALTLNPRGADRWRYTAYLSRIYLSMEKYREAAEMAREAARLQPNLPDALFRCAMAVAHVDAVDEARSLLERCEALDPGHLEKRRDWRPYPDEDRTRHLLAGLRRHGLLPE